MVDKMKLQSIDIGIVCGVTYLHLEFEVVSIEARYSDLKQLVTELPGILNDKHIEIIEEIIDKMVDSRRCHAYWNTENSRYEVFNKKPDGGIEDFGKPTIKSLK